MKRADVEQTVNEETLRILRMPTPKVVEGRLATLRRPVTVDEALEAAFSPVPCDAVYEWSVTNWLHRTGQRVT